MSKLNAGTLYRIGLIDWPKDQAVVKLETSSTTYTPSISKCLAYIIFGLDFAIYLYLEKAHFVIFLTCMKIRQFAL